MIHQHMTRYQICVIESNRIPFGQVFPIFVMHFDQQEVAKQMDQMAPNRRGNERADDGQGGGRGGR